MATPNTPPLHERPFRLKPNRVPCLIPGGRLIDSFMQAPADGTNSKSQMWLASTVQSVLKDAADTRSMIADEDGGGCFADLLQRNAEVYLGKEHAAAYGGNTGFLVKLLHSDDRLLVQAHPSKGMAKKYFASPFGKTEAWYILDTAAPDACIWLGFKPGVSRGIWQTLIRRQDRDAILASLHCFNVQKGDVVFIPAGIPHAMGKDILAAEIQEPTDITLRAERSRPDGSELPPETLDGGIGMDGLLDCFNFTANSYENTRLSHFISRRREYKAGGYTDTLLGTETTACFGMAEINCKSRMQRTNRRFTLLLAAEGEGSLITESFRIDLRKGSEIFIPHGVRSYSYAAGSSLTVMEFYPPALTERQRNLSDL